MQNDPAARSCNTETDWGAPRLLHPDLLLILLRSRRPDYPLWLSVLMGPISPLLLWLVLERGSLWARLHQTEPLGSTARRSHCRCLPLLLRLVSQMGVLLYDSPIYQLTETVKLDHCQAILELTTKPLPEASLLFLIGVYMVPRIL